MASASAQDPETQLRNAVTARVGELWSKADFAGLDLMADKFVQTKERTLSGKWRLAIFYGGMSDLLAISWPKDGYLSDEDGSCECKRPIPSKFDAAERKWDDVYAKVKQWIQRYPNSPHARIVEAQFFVNRAWFFRELDSRRQLPNRRGREFLDTSKMPVNRSMTVRMHAAPIHTGTRSCFSSRRRSPGRRNKLTIWFMIF